MSVVRQGYGLGGHVMCPECESVMEVVDWTAPSEWERGDYWNRPSFRVMVTFGCKNTNCAEDAERNRREDAEDQARMAA